MPQRDGISAGRAIHKPLPDTPLLLYTVLASSALEPDARNAGFRAVTAKGSASELITAIRNALTSHGSNPAGA